MDLLTTNIARATFCPTRNNLPLSYDLGSAVLDWLRREITPRQFLRSMMALWQLIFLFRALAPAAAATVAENSDEFANLSLIGDQVVPLDDGYGPNWTSSLILPAAYTSYELTGLVPGGRYRVRLRVATLEGWSPWSPEAGFFACEPPGPPSGLESVWNTGGLRPYLTWSAPEALGFGASDVSVLL
eukprot:s1459_g2.t1